MPSADPIMVDQPSKETRSPSPPPHAPTALTPGPRASRFVEVVDGALSTTLKAISYDHFADCFPTIAENAPDTLKNLHKQVTDRFGTFAKTEIESVFRERNVIENLNALEDLIADAQRRKSRAVEGEPPPTPPHTLPPTTVLSAHLASALASQQSQSNAKLQTIQSQNATIFSHIQAQRAEIEALFTGLEETIRDLEGAVEGLNENVPALRKETREVQEEVEMGGT